MNSCIKARTPAKQIAVGAFLALLFLSSAHISASSAARYLAALGNSLESLLDADSRERVQSFNLFEQAFLKCDIELVKTLITEGHDVNSLALYGSPVLHSAVRCDFEEGVELLLKHGARVNRKDLLKQETALHLAAHFGHPLSAAYLIGAGASINEGDYKGMSPLTRAAWQHQAGMVDLLIDSGAAVNHIDSFGTTPLHWVVVENYTPAVRRIVARLMRAKALINTPDNDGLTPLLWAIARGQKKAAQLLIYQGASLNVSFKNAYTPLMTAANIGSLEIAEMLREGGAEVNMVVRGKTALEVAAIKGHLDMVEWLLTQGAVITPQLKKIIPTLALPIRQKLNNHLKTPPRGAALAAAAPAVDFDDDDDVDVVVEKTVSTPAKNKTRRNKRKNKKAGAAGGAVVAAVAPAGEKREPAEIASEEPAAEPSPAAYFAAAAATPNPFAAFREASAGGSYAVAADDEVDELEYAVDTLPTSMVLPQVSVPLGDEGVIDFIFSPAPRSPDAGEVYFKTKSLPFVAEVKLLEAEEEKARECYRKERAAVVPMALRVADCSVASLRTQGVCVFSEETVDHVVNESLILNALRYGSSYLSRERATGKLPCLLVVAPVERKVTAEGAESVYKEKNFLTLCFEVDAGGTIGRCFHFCAQKKHPREINDGGEYKYALQPLHLKVKLRLERMKHKLQLKAASLPDFNRAYEHLLKR